MATNMKRALATAQKVIFEALQVLLFSRYYEACHFCFCDVKSSDARDLLKVKQPRRKHQ